ncbi:MAG: DUF2341 domain-containing protein, partial [Candidatus Nanohaloarchaea archaeon]|nr:DUF2341 domain-containing protein [Candidatus Nanohaloarchaea archaeon]
LRFATPDGTQLDYFHRYDDEVWVELPRLAANEQRQIHMYYGNEDARSRSSADDTLLFYDDFEDGTINDSWTAPIGPVEAADADGDGDLEMVSGNNNNYVTVRDLQLRNGYVEAATNSAGGGVNWINVRLINRTDCCGGNSLTFSINENGDETWDNLTASDWVGPGGSFTSIPEEPSRVRFGGWFFEQDAEAFVDTDQDNDADYTATTNDTVIEAGGIGMTDFDGSVWYDNFLVRNYTRPEPTVSIGSRQRRPGHNVTAGSSHSLGGSLLTTETQSLLGTARLGSREQDSSLVGYWPMDDRFGEVEDVSGNHNDGHFGYSALQFDGNDDYVRMNDSASLDVSEVTITAWVKRRQPCSDNAQVVNKLGGSAGYRLIACGGGNAVQFSYGDGSTLHHVSGTGGARRGEWSFVAATFNGSKIGFMTDGNYTVVDAPASTLATNSQPVDIADPSTGLGSGPFEGAIDSVRVYNRALSKQELLDLYTKNSVTNGLVMQQAFEEGPSQCDATSSNFCLTDDSGTGNAGEPRGFNNNYWNTGSGWANDNPLWTVRGKQGIRGGNAFQFDGEDDWIRVPDQDQLDIKKAVTVSAWVKLDGAQDTWKGIGIKNGAYRLIVAAGENAEWNIYDSSGAHKIFADQNLNDSQWHHLVGTYDGSRSLLYVDGDIRANMSLSTTIRTNNNDFFIGAEQANQQLFDGKIDEVRVYSRALSQEEVKSLHSPSPGLLSTSLLDGGRYTDWTNLSWDGTTPSGTNIEARVKTVDNVEHRNRFEEGAWSYRKPITVTEQAGTTLNNYPVKVTVDTGALISAGKLQSDCGDLRFWSPTHGTLDYWHASSECNTATTTVWVELPRLDKSAESTIYMYYGSEQADSQRDGTATFRFFDSFEDGNMDGWSDETGEFRINASRSYDGTYGLADTPGNDQYLHNPANDGTADNVALTTWVNARDACHSGLYIDNDHNSRSPIEYQTGPTCELKVYDGEIDNRLEIGNGSLSWGNLDTWYRLFLYYEPSTGDINISVFDTSNTMLASYSGTVETGQDRWGIFGWDTDYIYDAMVRRSYVSPEPTTTLGSEQKVATQTLTSGSYLSDWMRGSFDFARWQSHGGSSMEPVAGWRFDTGSGTTAVDSAGSNDGNLVNGPAWDDSCKYGG